MTVGDAKERKNKEKKIGKMGSPSAKSAMNSSKGERQKVYKNADSYCKQDTLTLFMPE